MRIWQYKSLTTCAIIFVVGWISWLTIHSIINLPIRLTIDEIFGKDMVKKFHLDLAGPLPLQNQPILQLLEKKYPTIQSVIIRKSPIEAAISITAKTICCRLGNNFVVCTDGSVVPAEHFVLQDNWPTVAVYPEIDQKTVALAAQTCISCDNTIFDTYKLSLLGTHIFKLENEQNKVSIIVHPGMPINTKLLELALRAAQLWREKSMKQAAQWCIVDTRFSKQLIVRRQTR